MFGDEVSILVGAWCPQDTELSLFCAVNEPMVTHVDGFGAFYFGGAGSETHSHSVINKDGCGRLRVSHFCAGCADVACVTCCLEGCANLGLHGRAQDKA